MKQFFKRTLGLCVALSAILGLSTPVNACTGVIVGSDVSEDGHYIFGRTEDLEVNHNKVYLVHEQGEYKKGDVLKDVSYDPDMGYEYTFTNDSFKYTSVSDTTPEYGIFDEAGFNEKGLIADMTVSATANDAVLEIDPYLDGSDEKLKIGITEAVITTVVLSSAETAQKAVELIANEVATKGTAEGNGLVVGDVNELWYMEIYTGHQFVAMKYPRDKFSVFPNTFWINEVVLETGEEKENYNISKDGNFIFSKGIFETAKAANKLVGDEATFTIDLAASYGPEELRDSNRSRVCSGILHLNKDADVNLESDVYEFLQDAGNKITLEDVFTFTQNRLENLNIEADDLSKDSLYPIGNRNTMEAHIFHVNKDNEDVYPGVMWLALGSPLVSPYVAYYPNQTAGIKEAQNKANEYNEDSVYWTAMDILHMVEANRDQFMPVVDKYLKPLQEELVKNVSLDKLSEEDATAKNNEDAAKALEVMKKIQAELKPLYEAYLNENDYVSKFHARRSTAMFEGSSITVTKGTADTKLNLKIDADNALMYIADNYGNMPEKLNHPIKYMINAEAFETAPSFKVNDAEITAVLENGYYVFESDGAEISFASSEATEETATPANTEKPKNNNFSTVILVGAAAAALATLLMKKKKR